jgi:hypothetical protein
MNLFKRSRSGSTHILIAIFRRLNKGWKCLFGFRTDIAKRGKLLALLYSFLLLALFAVAYPISSTPRT